MRKVTILRSVVNWYRRLSIIIGIVIPIICYYAIPNISILKCELVNNIPVENILTEQE